MTEYVIINQMDTRDFGVTCTFLPPVQIASERVTKQSVPGRSDYLHISDDSFETVTKTVGFFYDGENPSEVAEFFRKAKTVTFSNEPDRVYTCSVVGGSVLKNTIFNWHEFDVAFECNPEKREAEPQEINIEYGDVITNIGNRKTRPTFLVTGSGTVVLTVGAQVVMLASVADTFVVNGDLMECYTSLGVPQNSNMIGKFPAIEAGESVLISWTGSASVVMLPNWRWV